MKNNLAASLEAEQGALQHARAMLAAARSSEAGDPFDSATMHAVMRQMLKEIADSHERNSAYVLEMALAGIADAHEALADLTSERGTRGEPLGPALTTYCNILAKSGPPRIHRPHERPRANFLADLVVVYVLIDLMRRFGLPLRRDPNSKRLSACAIVSRVLIEDRISRGSEESIRRIFERHGPPALPAYLGPPKSGVMRFKSHDFL